MISNCLEQTLDKHKGLEISILKNGTCGGKLRSHTHGRVVIYPASPVDDSGLDSHSVCSVLWPATVMC
jgi:hypothetical protein